MVETRKPSHTRTSTRCRGYKLSDKQRKNAQEQFLASYEDCSTIREACIAANVDRSTYQSWLEHDEEFSLQFNQAKAISDDIVRSEIKRRAIDGWQEPIVSMGKVVYHQGQPLTVTKYSDTLLLRLAQSRMPEFREKQQVEHSGSIDVNGAKDSLLSRLGTLPREQSSALD